MTGRDGKRIAQVAASLAGNAGSTPAASTNNSIGYGRLFVAVPSLCPFVSGFGERVVQLEDDVLGLGVAMRVAYDECGLLLAHDDHSVSPLSDGNRSTQSRTSMRYAAQSRETMKNADMRRRRPSGLAVAKKVRQR